MGPQQTQELSAFLVGLPDEIQTSESLECSAYTWTRHTVRSQILGMLGLRLPQGLIGRLVRTHGLRSRTWDPHPTFSS